VRLPGSVAHVPPARRRFFAALCAGVATVAVVAAGCSVVGGEDDSPAPAAITPPAVTLPPTASPRGTVPQPGPVLLVHGYGGTSASLTRLAAQLRSLGRTAVIVDPVGDNTGDLNEQVAGLESAVTAAERAGAPSVDVVGYSAGGVVALTWSKRHDGATRARRIVSLGSPFHGTQIAATALATAPELCPTACRQLAPGSDLLRSLDVDGAGAAHPAWLALWTRLDTVVTPPESAQLKGAVTLPVQQVCPGVSVGHSDLPADPVILRMVLAALGEGPLQTPTSAACS
jgi:triacylglycerol lipase